MKRKITLIVLSFVSMLCMADYPTSITALKKDGAYSYTNAVHYTSDDGGSIGYNPNTGVLTLRNYDGAPIHNWDGGGSELTIRVVGDCKITSANSNMPSIYAIVKKLNIVMAKGASLTIRNSNPAGAYTINGDDASTSGTYYDLPGSTCITSHGDVNIYTEDDTTPSSVSLYSEQKNISNQTKAIVAPNGKLSVIGNVNLDVKIKQSVAVDAYSCGVEAKSIYINTIGTITIDASDAVGGAWSMYTNGYNVEADNASKMVFSYRYEGSKGAMVYNSQYPRFDWCGSTFTENDNVVTYTYRKYDEVIKNVNINAPMLGYGVTVNEVKESCVSADETYGINDLVFYRMDDAGNSTAMSGTDTFEAGEEYEVRMELSTRYNKDHYAVFPIQTTELETVKINAQSVNFRGVDVNTNRTKFTLRASVPLYTDTFDIKIAGQFVTGLNCSDLTAIPGVTGTASYDSETNTLYLEDASIAEMTMAGRLAVENEIDSLKINVTGDCSISSAAGTGIKNNSKTLIITGTGTLNITGGNGIVMTNTNRNSLVIDGNVTVNVTADNYGVQGATDIQRVLGETTKIYYRTTLKVGGANSKLSVNGTTRCFLNLGGFTPANGYEVTAPSRTAYYGASDGVDYHTFCRLSVSFGKELSGSATTTLTPVKDTAVVIEKTVTYQPGDVNHDGSITMADANVVVNYFLSTDKPEDFDKTTADVNEDGTITMADANMIVNMFLGQ